MSKKKTVRHSHKTVHHTRRADLFTNAIGTISLVLICDAILRIAFAIPLFTLSYGGLFHWRWFFIGIIEVILAFGIFREKKWALFGLLFLSAIRVYTILFFPPVGMLPPIEKNMTLYLTKIMITFGAFYFFSKRKYFT